MRRSTRSARLFDGISIGSNDLTQLTLGVDRDSALVAFEFDERDPGVLEMLRQAVDGRAPQRDRHAAICGQAPSDHPDVAAFLVGPGHRRALAQPRQRAPDHPRGAGDRARSGRAQGLREREHAVPPART
jgi:phosphoenolpyruvate-protein kinase (PTS system EI component)